MVDEITLLTVGPVSPDQTVLDAMSEPVIPHYGKEWIELYTTLVAGLQEIFQTSNDLYPVTGPGSAAFEMGVGSVAAAGETVIVVNNGFFGKRAIQIAQMHGLNVVEVEAPVDVRVGAEQVRPALEANPGTVAVIVIHQDTTTGVLNDIGSIGPLAKEHGALTIVDAVSSLGAVNLPVDEWDIDICVTVANKGLGAPPGISPLSVSPRAWAVVDSKETHGWYLNLRTWRWYVENWGDWHPYPTTVATSTARALNVAVETILDEGLQNVFKRHATVARTVRDGLREMGFAMLLPEEESSDALTAAHKLDGMDVPDYQTWLVNEHGLMISGGLAELKGKIFRVGHMGLASRPEVAERYLEATREYVAKRM